MSIRKVASLLEVLGNPGALRTLFALRTCFSISSFRINAGIVMYQSVFNTIIDVGANIGQFSLAATQRFPMSKIYCFEPVPDVYRCLKNNIKRFKSIYAFNCAIGDINGNIALYRNDYTPASSVLIMHEENNRFNCNMKLSRRIDVEIYRGDDLIPTLDIKGPLLLKLDVQGYEMNVLKGLTKAIKHIDYIVLEASFTELYEDQPLFDELHEYLKFLGFEFVAPVDFSKGNNCEIVEMDILYKRAK